MASSVGTKLNRAQFDVTERLIALRVQAKQASSVLKNLKPHILARARQRTVVPDDEHPDCRLVLLSEKVNSIDLTELGEEGRAFISESNAQPVVYDLKYGYSFFNSDEILRKILPEGVEVPSSFETIGHVAHFNLREEHLPYKGIIGEVVLDKNPKLRSVVNKVSSITNQFRVFPMEILAGDGDMEVEVRENSATFRFDFSEVYWNSRLQREHGRVVDLLPRDAVLCDMFAGVGPFAVPAGMRGCTVWANDLNPKSFAYLEKNVSQNKVGKRVRSCNLDAREFARKMMSGELGGRWDSDGKMISGSPPFTHATMNLPASAVEFLDVFDGGLPPSWTWPAPTIYCYMFSTNVDDLTNDALAQIRTHLGTVPPNCVVHNVRDVSPHKRMLCAQFQIPPPSAWSEEVAAKRKMYGAEENTTKRNRVD